MTPADWLAVVAMFALLWLVMLSPLLVPLYLALRGGSSVPRRWLFVFLAACSGYGFVVLLLALLAYPIEFIVSFVAPQMFYDHPSTRVVAPALDIWYRAKAWYWGPALVVFSVWFATKFWRRWPRIAETLT